MKIVSYMVIIALVGLFSFSAGESMERERNAEVSAEAKVKEKEENVIKDNDGDFSDMIERILPAVVAVESEGKEEEDKESFCSGVIVSEMGYIATSKSISQNSDKVRITLYDGSIYTGKVCWRDEFTDLAIVKYDGIVPIAAETGEKNQRIGDEVYTISSSSILQFERSISKGIISGLNRSAIEEDIYIDGLIETDISVKPQAAGGPLINSKGEVIGINTLIADGTGFAIPVSILELVIEAFETQGTFETPYLGFWGYNTRTAGYLKRDKSMHDGVYVAQLDSDGPAFRAGLHYGDVICEINDEKISDLTRMREVIFKMKIGDKAVLRVVSGKVKKDIEIEIESQKSSDKDNKNEKNENI